MYYIQRPSGELILKSCVQNIRRWTKSRNTVVIYVNTFGARYVMFVLGDSNRVLK
jgi:hypothetical protein